jgi:hypothetical protein
MKKWFRGIDFANNTSNLGECWVCDDGTDLTTCIGPTGESAVLTAIDCPFGTTRSFAALIGGRQPKFKASDLTFKYRETEIWLRSHVNSYNTVKRWGQIRGSSKTSYFNATAHIQPAAGMVIVPELLNGLLGGAYGKVTLSDARLGCGSVVEAHPRAFLYSAVERIDAACPATPLQLGTLDSVRRYKKDRNARQDVFNLLSQCSQWQGAQQRKLISPQNVAGLIASDHVFDAWLCALTAWAHKNGETATWRDASKSHALLSKRTVRTEGHMLILKQAS